MGIMKDIEDFCRGELCTPAAVHCGRPSADGRPYEVYS